MTCRSPPENDGYPRPAAVTPALAIASLDPRCEASLHLISRRRGFLMDKKTKFGWMSILALGANFSLAWGSAVEDIRAARKRGDLDGAIRLATQALASGELSLEDQAIAFYNRGVTWEKKKELERAIADFNEAIRLNPHYVPAFYDRGVTWEKKKDYDRAIADYNEAIRLNPKYALAFNNRGIAWGEKKDYDRAIADYNEAIKLNPKGALAFNNRGNAWYEKKDYDRAIADYSEAIRLNPQFADVFGNRGHAWYSKKDYDPPTTTRQSG